MSVVRNLSKMVSLKARLSFPFALMCTQQIFQKQSQENLFMWMMQVQQHKVCYLKKQRKHSVRTVKLNKHFNKWHIRIALNAGKTTSLVFLPNNRQAGRPLHLKIDEFDNPNNDFPRYLGVKLDRILTYRQHIKAIRS